MTDDRRQTISSPRVKPQGYHNLRSLGYLLFNQSLCTDLTPPGRSIPCFTRHIAQLLAGPSSVLCRPSSVLLAILLLLATPAVSLAAPKTKDHRLSGIIKSTRIDDRIDMPRLVRRESPDKPAEKIRASVSRNKQSAARSPRVVARDQESDRRRKTKRVAAMR